jgi:hypothetical protein
MIRFFLVLLLLSWTTGASGQNCGTERRPIKDSLPTGANLTQSKTVSLADLLKMPDPQPKVHKNQAEFQKQRIPAFSNPLNVKEGDIVTVTGWLHLVALEGNDTDYHIQISGSQDSGEQCLIVEVPEPGCVDSADLKPKFQTIRDWVKKNLLRDPSKEPSSGGSVMQHPLFVRVTGQLFYDDSHVGDNPRGKKQGKPGGGAAATLWEIHPITDLQFAPKPQ